jgi:putative FmdB family regulatory protein
MRHAHVGERVTVPIYEYRCTSCDHLAEVIHGINDPSPRYCESCGAEGTMRKGIGAPAVLFKGSGWARKDRPSRPASSPSRSEGQAGASSKGDGGAASSDGSSGAKASASSGADD